MRKTKLTRLIAVFLSILMIGSVFTATTAAASTDDGNTSNLSYDIKDIQDLLNSEEYAEYAVRNADVKRAKKEIKVDVLDYAFEPINDDAPVAKVSSDGKYLITPESGVTTWTVDIPSTAKYAIKIEYSFPTDGASTAIERKFKVDNEYPFKGARYLSLQKVWLDEIENYTFDNVGGNDVRPNKYLASDAWETYYMGDSTGYVVEPYEIVFEKGEHTISLEATREVLYIKSITLYPYEDLPTYAEVLADYQKNGYTAAVADPIVIQAEFTTATSAKTIFPQNDRTSPINEPQSPTLSKLNTIGGTKWQSVGQWIEYKFTPTASGLYDIVPRYKQAELSGMYTSRRIYIKEGDGEYKVPFAEASYLQFNYSDEWKTNPLNDGTTSFQFYFEAGKEYTIRFEVVLGNMGEIIGEIQSILTSLNNDYLKILQITGPDPDNNRDYNFRKLIPDTIRDLYVQGQKLKQITQTLDEINGGKSSNTATLENIYRILDKMATDEDEVAANMGNLKSNVGSLGTWLNTARNQPLLFDYISIQPTGGEMPRAEANFFQSTWFEIRAFVGSFFTDYSNLGNTETLGEGAVIDVWAQTDRDSALVMRNLCDNYFTATSGIAVNLRLVAAGTLLPATLSGTGPDVALENAQNVPITYAIRNAVLPLNPEGYLDAEGDDAETLAYKAQMREIFSDFDEVTKEFSPSALVPLSLYGVTYGLPETQTFPMMFYRKDVLAELGLDIPRTWDDLMAMVPVLQYNHMEVGIPSSSAGLNLFLYQMGGELYADDGMRINLDSNLALEAFDTMCSYFTQYSFPYTFDAANRFRTGEMPIIISDYIGMYNQLTLFATEIRDLWEFVPVIGMEDENGNFNGMSTSTVTSIIMMNGCEKQESAWEFMKWFTSTPTQAQYANEKVAIVGEGAMYATANMEAVMELPWTSQEKENIQAQYDAGLATIPEYPGGYIIARYVDFAFLAAYNSNADPVESLLGYVDDINKEITRKRQEFDLETLELGETLAEKRAREQQENSGN